MMLPFLGGVIAGCFNMRRNRELDNKKIMVPTRQAIEDSGKNGRKFLRIARQWRNRELEKMRHEWCWQVVKLSPKFPFVRFEPYPTKWFTEHFAELSVEDQIRILKSDIAPMAGYLAARRVRAAARRASGAEVEVREVDWLELHAYQADKCEPRH